MRYSRIPRLVGLLLITLLALPSVAAHAQLDEHCTISILNRTARVKADGSWRIDNVPANFGRVRARATCTEDGVTRSGQSGFLTIQRNQLTGFESHIPLTVVDPIPASLAVTASPARLTEVGATAQLRVTATLPNGSTRDVTPESTGTSYTISNRAVATVSPAGVVTAVSSGTVLISALNEGALGLLRLQVALTSGDSDGDGIPDDVETANGLNPNDPTDAALDPDGDGLTNKQELIDYSTNPQVADTDGDGVRDGLEVETGSNPLDPGSVNLGQALGSLTVSPSVSGLTVNIIVGEASRQLTVTGHLRDGTSLDLTATRAGTNYTSSDLTLCSFGEVSGQIFAGAAGICTVTATNNGFSATATITVQTFTPTALSALPIPGTTNNVDVSGHYAYVAAGPAGLQVVDASDPSTPVIVGALDTPGNANDVQIVDQTAFVADGPAGLRIIDVTNPRAPVLRGTVDTPGDAQDIAVTEDRVVIADGSNGLQVVDITNRAAPVLIGTVDTPGEGLGVAIADDGMLAVVADGYSGLQIVDLTEETHPSIIGVLPDGNAQDVELGGNFAFVADMERSFTSVDLTNPRTPVLLASTPRDTGGLLNDVALAGQFAVGADVFFVNDVPILDVSDPATPQPRALLPFRSFGDDNGTGIAVDGQFVYLTTDFNRLLIGQYLAFPDDIAGISPTVTITAPTAESTVPAGALLEVTVVASDDVAVREVELLVNDQVVGRRFSGGTAQFIVPIPVDATQLKVSARATDVGGNVGIAPAVLLTVVPDVHPPAVRILSPTAGSSILAGNILSMTVEATDNAAVVAVEILVNGQVIGTDATAPYEATYPVPVASPSLTIGARAVDPQGNVGVASEVTVTVIPDLPPTVAITAPANGATVIAGDTLTVTVTATDDLGIEMVRFFVDGKMVFTDARPPYRLVFPVPSGQPSLTLGAVAVDELGQVGEAENVQLHVIADPLTSASGRVVDRNGTPVGGATVRCGTQSGVTAADGTFIVTGLATITGPVQCVASVVTGEDRQVGVSLEVTPVRGGTTAIPAVALTLGGRGPLYPGQKWEVGGGAWEVAVADFNGDGAPDLVAANGSAPEVALFLGNGDATFQPPVHVVTGAPSVSLIVADLNHDSDMDVVTANYQSNDLSVVLGNGDGTFQPVRRFVVGTNPVTVAVADLDEDGVLDLIVLNGDFTRTISILRGNGDGTFQAPQSMSRSSMSAVAVADFDLDGIVDILVTDTSFNSVRLLLGHGDATFEEQPRVAVGGSPSDLSVGDLNGDRIPDVVVTNATSHDVSILVGKGDGTFLPQQRVAVGEFPASVTVADLDGDRIVDVITTSAVSNDLSVLLGIGDGTFATQQRFPVRWEPVSVVAADLNFDNVLDVVVGTNLSRAVSVLLGAGDGTLGAGTLVSTPSIPTTVLTADLNRDTQPDLVMTTEAGMVLTQLGTGGRTFGPSQTVAIGAFARMVAEGDLNRDGSRDLVVLPSSGTTRLAVVLGNGDGTFQASRLVSVGGAVAQALAVADFNADGKFDLGVLQHFPSPRVAIFLGNGDGTFQAGRFSAVTGSNFEVVPMKVADLTGDGVVDLAVLNQSLNQLRVLRGVGDGTFVELSGIAVGTNPTGLAIADLNVDLRPDVMVTLPDADEVAVLLGTGGGAFGAPVRLAVGDGPAAVVSGDVDGDSHLDLVVTNQQSHDVSVLRGQGDGTFEDEERFDGGRESQALSVADFDRDGGLDVVVTQGGNAPSGVVILFRR